MTLVLLLEVDRELKSLLENELIPAGQCTKGRAGKDLANIEGVGDNNDVGRKADDDIYDDDTCCEQSFHKRDKESLSPLLALQDCVYFINENGKNTLLLKYLKFQRQNRLVLK